MLTAIPLMPIKNENYSRQPLPFNPSTTVIPRYDLRASILPRHVRLLIGEAVFYEQDAPPV